MKEQDLLEKIFAALKFICRPLGVPEQIVFQASHAAAAEIVRFQRESVPSGNKGHGAA